MCIRDRLSVLLCFAFLICPVCYLLPNGVPFRLQEIVILIRATGAQERVIRYVSTGWTVISSRDQFEPRLYWCRRSSWCRRLGCCMRSVRNGRWVLLVLYIIRRRWLCQYVHHTSTSTTLAAIRSAP